MIPQQGMSSERKEAPESVLFLGLACMPSSRPLPEILCRHGFPCSVNLENMPTVSYYAI